VKTKHNQYDTYIMKKVQLIAAILLALPLIIFGGNYFVQLFPLPPGDSGIGDQLLQMMRDGGLMRYVAFAHVFLGVLLLIPKTRTVAALLHIPITMGMVCFHIAMLPAGTAMAAIMLLLNVLAAWDKDKLKALL